MEDRLSELKRQRALVAEHLQWLDREILRSVGVEPPSPPPAAPVPPVAPAPASPVTATVPGKPPLAPAVAAAAPAPETSLVELSPSDRQNIQSEMKRGCFIWVAIAAVLIIIAFGLMWWIGRMQRPAPKPKEDPVESRRDVRDLHPPAFFVAGVPHGFGHAHVAHA